MIFTLARKGIILLSTIIVFSCLLIFVARAGEYHGGSLNVCSDCHSMHASEGGQPVTVSGVLLKSADGELGLCMSCHDGTNLQAPDIVAAGTSANPSDAIATGYSSKYGSSAGFYQNDYLTNDSTFGHDLRPQATAIAPLSNTYRKDGGLLCSDCHNVHGAANYRNLIADPNPLHAGAFPITLGTDVRETIPVNTQAPNPAVAYDSGNIGYVTTNNIQGWCTDCHDQLADNATGGAPAHFLGHPSGVAIGELNAHTDSNNWITPLGQGNTGFGSTVGDQTAGIPRLRYGSPTGSNQTVGINDTVTCLSCHKAHGSKYKKGMVWPYMEGGADSISGCQQCHFK